MSSQLPVIEWDRKLQNLSKHKRMRIIIRNPKKCYTEDSVPSIRRASIIREGQSFLVKRNTAETLEFFDTEHGRKNLSVMLHEREAEFDCEVHYPHGISI